MAGFDRSKFAATKVSSIQKQEGEIEKKSDFNKGNKNTFLKLVEGKNKVRIFPAHPGTETFYQPCMVHFLPILNEWTTNDGEKKSEIKRKPVFSAKMHSSLGKCPIDSYIHFAYKIAGEEYQDKAEREKFVKPIKGREGITGNTSFIVYAEIKGQFGRLQLKKSVKNALNEITIGQDDDDGIISTDPFTDPDTGRAVFITYDKQTDRSEKDKKPEDYYKTAIDIKGPTPLSDEQLAKLCECKSLEELYVDVYTRKDFDLAVEGLKRFDDDKKLGVFASDEFLDELEAIAEALPEIDEEEEGDESQKEGSENETSDEAETSEGQEEEEEESPFEANGTTDIQSMSLEQLQETITENKLPIRLTQRTSLEDARDWVEDEMKILEETSAANQREKEEEKKETKGRRRGSSGRLSEMQKDLKKG